jgi:nucleotide-binding universal stress UspA family protein
MLPLKTILVPTDFSTRSYPAIDAAIELAQQFSAELVVLHVLGPIPTALPTSAGEAALSAEIYRDALYEDSRQALDDLVHERIPEGIRCRTDLEWGSPAVKIVDHAATQNADLIVICTRGATGLARLVMGSVAEKVVRLSDVPVLTVQATDDD